MDPTTPAGIAYEGFAEGFSQVSGMLGPALPAMLALGALWFAARLVLRKVAMGDPGYGLGKGFDTYAEGSGLSRSESAERWREAHPDPVDCGYCGRPTKARQGYHAKCRREFETLYGDNGVMH